MLMRYPFTSPEARDLNKRIFEVMYYAALEASCELAEKLGKPKHIVVNQSVIYVE